MLTRGSRDERLPEEHRHQRLGVEGRLRRGVRCGADGRPVAAEHVREPVGVHLAKFERHAVLLDGVADLVLRVGQGRPARRARLPRGGGLDRPLRVVVAERPPQRLLDQVHHRPGHEEAEQHRHREPGRRPDQAGAQLLQVLAERHRRALEQVFVGGAGHGGLVRTRGVNRLYLKPGCPGAVTRRTCRTVGRGPSPAASGAWPGRSRSRRGGTRAPRTSSGRRAGRCRRPAASAPDASCGS